MSTTPVTRALFEGLVYDESGNPVEVAAVGGVPCYVVDDDGFRVHVTSEPIDRQIIESFREQFLQHREIATEAMLKMLGSDDLFTKAAIDASVENMDRVLHTGLPEEARMTLGILGFRVIINTHGDLVRIDMPEQAEADDGSG
jgi:hypothetical protein